MFRRAKHCVRWARGWWSRKTVSFGGLQGLRTCRQKRRKKELYLLVAGGLDYLALQAVRAIGDTPDVLVCIGIVTIQNLALYDQFGPVGVIAVATDDEDKLVIGGDAVTDYVGWDVPWISELIGMIFSPFQYTSSSVSPMIGVAALEESTVTTSLPFISLPKGAVRSENCRMGSWWLSCRTATSSAVSCGAGCGAFGDGGGVASGCGDPSMTLRVSGLKGVGVGVGGRPR